MPAVTVSNRAQSFTAQQNQMKKSWKIVNAEGVSLGRLAAEVAIVLMGKHRPEYTAHVDCGDYVVVTNGTKVVLTGRKAEQRLKLHYTGYPGGLKAQSYGQVRERQPEKLIGDAVRRMLPKNRLGRVMLGKLRVFPGAQHDYADKNPVEMKI